MSEETPLVRKRKRRDEDTEMDMTPMIDVTFLLLIFFLVAGRIEGKAPVILPPAEHASRIASKQAAIITIDENGSIYLGDGIAADMRLNAADEADMRTKVSLYVSQNLVGGKKYVLVKAAFSLKHREVAKVLSAIGGAPEAQTIHIAVLEDL